MSRFPWWILPLVASWLYAAWLYSLLPATVPVHWNLAGQIDRFGSRAEAALLLPCIMLVIALVMGLATSRRPGLQPLALVTLSFMFVVQLITGYAFLHGGLQTAVFGGSPLLALLPLALGWGYAGWLFTRLPERVPMHWGLNGEVDRYGGRAEGAFLLPGIFTLIAGVMFAISRQAPLLLVTGFFLALQVCISLVQLRWQTVQS
jgi:uncharacterized membrane protein